MHHFRHYELPRCAFNPGAVEQIVFLFFQIFDDCAAEPIGIERTPDSDRTQQI